MTDKSMGGTIGQTNPQIAWFPVAIIGETAVPSVLIVGSDSIGHGFNDTFDANGNNGFLEKAIGNKFGVINAGTAGDSVNSFVTAGRSTRRQALQQYVSHVIMQGGCNDIRGGSPRSAAQVTADIQTALGLFSGKRCYRTTISPSLFSYAAISSLTSSGTLVTATTTAAHNLTSGMQVAIKNASPSTYNGVFPVTVTSANSFTYNTASAPASTPATGSQIIFDDQYETAANQFAVSAAYAVGGAIDTINTNIIAGIPGSLGVFDPWPVAIDRGTNKWLADGTPFKSTEDGIHPSPSAHAAMAANIASAVQAMNRTGL